MQSTHYTLAQIEQLERAFRLNLINSIAGFKPAVLIGTQSASGQTNLAIFNSVIHLGSNPPMQAFTMRPHTVERHTLENIQETGYYTLNHVHSDMVENAHYTSAKFPREVSEFEACGLTPAYKHDFPAPFAAESRIQLGMKLETIVPLPTHAVQLVIGTVQHLTVPTDALPSSGRLNLPQAGTVAVSGLNRYHTATELMELPYARLENLPEFASK